MEQCQQHSGLVEKITSGEKECDDLRDALQRAFTKIDELKNRLPIWATILISILTFTIGVLTKMVFS